MGQPDTRQLLATVSTNLAIYYRFTPIGRSEWSLTGATGLADFHLNQNSEQVQLDLKDQLSFVLHQ